MSNPTICINSGLMPFDLAQSSGGSKQEEELKGDGKGAI
jgi:hypothetical protein